VKEKANTPELMAFDDDMDLLDGDKSLLMKDGSPPPIDMVITLPAEFRGAEEEVTQMCLNPREVMFENPMELSQHMKPMNVQGHINGRPISRMLIDGGGAINLMSYSIFKKLRREDDELMKTNLTLNSMGATQWRLEASSPWGSP
jgi:hypothetical protein